MQHPQFPSVTSVIDHQTSAIIWLSAPTEVPDFSDSKSVQEFLQKEKSLSGCPCKSNDFV